MNGFMEWIHEHQGISLAFVIVAVLLLASQFIKNKNAQGSGITETSGLSQDQHGNPVVYVPTGTYFSTQTDYTASPVNSPGSTLTTGDIPTVGTGSSLTYSPSQSTTNAQTSNYAPSPTTTTTGLSGSDTASLVSSLGATQAQLTPNVTNSNNTTTTKNSGNTTATSKTTSTSVSGKKNTVISQGSTGIPPVHTVVKASHPAPTHHVSGTPNQPPGVPVSAPHPRNPNPLPPVRAAPVQHPVTTHIVKQKATLVGG